jgi:hypothetical protein
LHAWRTEMPDPRDVQAVPSTMHADDLVSNDIDRFALS